MKRSRSSRVFFFRTAAGGVRRAARRGKTRLSTLFLSRPSTPLCSRIGSNCRSNVLSRSRSLLSEQCRRAQGRAAATAERESGRRWSRVGVIRHRRPEGAESAIAARAPLALVSPSREQARGRHSHSHCMLAAQVLFTGPQERKAKVAVVVVSLKIDCRLEKRIAAARRRRAFLAFFFSRRRGSSRTRAYREKGKMNKNTEGAKQQMRQKEREKREAETKKQREQSEEEEEEEEREQVFFLFFLRFATTRRSFSPRPRPPSSFFSPQR